ncbi:FAR-17a/AIG1-like protein [Delphinella strobiligena]|nr:FAR-17a/AIG1-like protein [Delphinella strobiligena]
MAANIAKELAKRHPQQRMNSPSQGASALLHIAGLASFAYSFNWLAQDDNPVNEAFGSHWQHLTIIGLSLSTLTFFVGLLADITLCRRLFTLKNVFSVASAPMEVLISLLYWGLSAVNPRLVMPEWAPVLPFAADFSFHAMPAIMLAIDLLFFSPPYAVGVLPAFGLSSIIAVGYWFWVELCFTHNGWYPYPIFDVLDTPGRAALFAGSALTMTLSTLSLKWVYERVNGQLMDKTTKPS